MPYMNVKIITPNPFQTSYRTPKLRQQALLESILHGLPATFMVIVSTILFFDRSAEKYAFLLLFFTSQPRIFNAAVLKGSRFLKVHKYQLRETTIK